MNVLEMIANRHEEWIRISIYLGCGTEEAKEVVQRMYLKLAEIRFKEGNLMRLISYRNDINTVYMFKVLQNLTNDIKKTSKEVSFPEGYTLTTNDESSEVEYDKLLTDIKDAISQMHHYDQMLLDLHFKHGKSMRQIERETGIPTYSIFNSIKNAKTRIKERTESSYRDYEAKEADKKTFHGLRRFDSEGD
jgi:DNA-directed RNA polymerase specialized sigma subunit